jgi:hypothetical protein
MHGPIRWLRDFLNNKFTDGVITIALVLVGLSLIYLAFRLENKFEKASVLAWTLLP